MFCVDAVDNGEGGVMTAARLRLASVLVVVARWSTDLDVIFFLVIVVLP